MRLKHHRLIRPLALAATMAMIATTLALAFAASALAKPQEPTVSRESCREGRINFQSGTVIFCTLKPGGTETGGWSATISEPAGAPQTQANGVASFPIPYPEEGNFTPPNLKATYRNEAEAIAPRAPCLGSTNEPVAEPGNLCVYRGEGIPQEHAFEPGFAHDENAKFVAFQLPGGELRKSGELLPTESITLSSLMIVFRTDEFNERTGEVTLAKPAHLTAAGSWALTAN